MRKIAYAGLDVHAESIVAVCGAANEELRTLTVPHNEEGVMKLLARIGRLSVRAAYEASGCGFGLYDRLKAEGWEMFVLAPTHMAKSVKDKKTKTDVQDAKRIREMLLAHGELGTDLPTVWVPPVKVRQDRELVRRRLALGERISRAKASILSLLRMHGIRRPEEFKTLWTKKHKAWLAGLGEDGSELPAMMRTVLSGHLRELTFMELEAERFQQEVEALAQEEAYREPVARMTELSGVGTLTAMTFYLELGDPKRFKNRKQVGSYLGLTPGSFESGEAKDRKGHITRMGPSRIRKVLNQSAWAVIRENAGWRAPYTRLSEHRGVKKALVAIMRRLGIDLWRRAVAA